MFESETEYSDGQLVYHVGGYKFDKLNNLPTWFALEKSHSDSGWFQNMLDSAGEAYQYQARISGKVAHIFDDEIEGLFNSNNIDADDWIMSIIENPEPNEVLKLKGTELLMKTGYDGIVYPDYDPNDWDSDLDALIVFKPDNSVRDFKLIKSKK